jgi:hypothetical protein
MAMPVRYLLARHRGSCELPPGLPPEVVRQHGKLLRAKGDAKRVVADITAVVRLHT